MASKCHLATGESLISGIWREQTKFNVINFLGCVRLLVVNNRKEDATLSKSMVH